jgi:hypothetical protein
MKKRLEADILGQKEDDWKGWIYFNKNILRVKPKWEF